MELQGGEVGLENIQNPKKKKTERKKGRKKHRKKWLACLLNWNNFAPKFDLKTFKDCQQVCLLKKSDPMVGRSKVRYTNFHHISEILVSV